MIEVENLTEEEKKAVAEIKEEILALVGGKLRGFYLFGSKARGDYDPESDVDLAILVDGLDKTTKERIIDIVADKEIKFLVVVSSLVLSWKEFSDLRERERRIALDIESEGIPL
jgi:predicted nucleotidyltransferase